MRGLCINVLRNDALAVNDTGIMNVCSVSSTAWVFVLHFFSAETDASKFRLKKSREKEKEKVYFAQKRTRGKTTSDALQIYRLLFSLLLLSVCGCFTLQNEFEFHWKCPLCLVSLGIASLWEGTYLQVEADNDETFYGVWAAICVKAWRWREYSWVLPKFLIFFLPLRLFASCSHGWIDGFLAPFQLVFVENEHAMRCVCVQNHKMNCQKAGPWEWRIRCSTLMWDPIAEGSTYVYRRWVDAVGLHVYEC